MEDAALVGGFERLRDLECEPETFGDWNRAPLEPLGERLALDQLGDQERRAVGFFKAVDTRSAGMVERRQRPRRRLDPRAPLGVVRERRREGPDRDLATPAGIAGAPQRSHVRRGPSRGDGSQDGVGAELGAGSNRHIVFLRPPATLPGPATSGGGCPVLSAA